MHHLDKLYVGPPVPPGLQLDHRPVQERGRSDDLRKLPWSCLALRTQDNVGPVPSVAILFGSMQGKTVKPGQVDVPGVVR